MVVAAVAVAVAVAVVVGVAVAVAVVVVVGVGVAVAVAVVVVVVVAVIVNKCQDCAKYRPDPINPISGLGGCDEPKSQVLTRSWEHGEYKWHYQEKLTYPGSEACGEYKEIRRSQDDNNARA